MTKQLLVVLGMHRSGTSALTRGLQVLGIDLGENLLGADKEVNAKGFWEDRDILALNNDIQEALGLRWDNLKPISEEDCQRDVVREFIPRAIGLLNEKMAGKSFFGMKDPRTSVVLPFWRYVFDLLGVKVHYLIASRNPLSIVNSLAKRDALIPEYSLQLWQNYMLASLQYTEGESRLVVDFDLLLKNPGKQLERISNLLKLDFSVSSDSFLEFKAGFLDQSLRHTQYEIEDFRNTEYVTSEQFSLYHFLSKLAQDDINFDSEEYKDEISDLLKKYSVIKPLLTLSGMQSRELTRLASKLHTPLVQICLYLDNGSGFSEDLALRKQLDYPCGYIKESFSLAGMSGFIESFRLDPINIPCVISLNKFVLKTDLGEVDLKKFISHNACAYEGGKYYFATYDPQFIVSSEFINDKTVSSIEIDIEFLALEEQALNLCKQAQEEQLKRLIEKHKEQINVYSSRADEVCMELERKSEFHIREIERIKTEHTNEIDLIKCENEENYAAYQKAIDDLNRVMDAKQTAWEGEKEAILRFASCWLTQPLRKIMLFLRGGKDK
ncbi:hypothetical protein Q9290_09525 [Oceanimonas sp. CHS3-5]|uniref:sulfotransferase family protein n=1 Tax=Oceanimonas sp. CHS3-5 TaxID=3068186 RepID=UPI00273F409A|nr:hypothetical protein [Oceanimonas sp. CHS3-5]MDP5292528.1 hypothetical protein [Oceanimonas sp. CHS3-5]